MELQSLEKPEQASSRKRSFRILRHSIPSLLSLILGFLWLAPAIFLVIWTIQGHVIGGSAWCPKHSCGAIFAQLSSNDTQALTDKEDIQGRDLLGGLQYAAKVMEMWFIFVAASLVYIVAHLLARGREGIPIGYMFTHVEFADLLSLFSWSLWCSHRKPNAKDRKRKSVSTKWFLFLGLVTFLCLLSSFMGPSVAVLILPTLDYWDSPFVPQQKVDQVLSAAPPKVLPDCSQAELLNNNYTCAYVGPGQALDALAADAAFSENQHDVEIAGTVGIPEGDLIFSVNFTHNSKTDYFQWIPLRQVIRDLNQISSAIYSGDPTFNDALNSLELYLQRKAPVVAFSTAVNFGNISTTFIDETRQIRCFASILANMTECHRVGPGWKGGSPIYSFFVGDSSNSTSSVQVDSYNSPRDTCVPSSSSQFGSNGCLPNGTLQATNCDFDSIFSTPCNYISSDLGNVDQNSVWESWIPNGPVPDARYIVAIRWVFASATYQYDVSPLSNFLEQVVLPDLPEPGPSVPPLSVDPSWILAGMSISNGSLVPLNRTIGRLLSNSTLELQEELWFNTTDVSDDAIESWVLPVLLANSHAASFVPYNFTEFYPNSSTAMPSTPNPSWDSVASQDTPDHPVVWSNFRRRVWLFGIQNRRTAVLGIVIVLMGSVVVLVRTALKAWTGIRVKSPVELMVGALEHQPEEDFEGVKRSDRHLGAVRFGVHERDEQLHFVRKVQGQQ